MVKVVLHLVVFWKAQQVAVLHVDDDIKRNALLMTVTFRGERNSIP